MKFLIRGISLKFKKKERFPKIFHEVLKKTKDGFPSVKMVTENSVPDCRKIS